jgi:hypothetical protein
LQNVQHDKITRYPTELTLRGEEVLRSAWNNPHMHSAITGHAVAVTESAREGRWNWGLMLAVAFCLLFWAAAIFGLLAVV